MGADGLTARANCNNLSRCPGDSHKHTVYKHTVGAPDVRRHRWVGNMRYRRALIIAALAALAILTTLPPSGVRAETLYPWCAHYGGGWSSGGINCGFVTYDQCKAAISGAGGWCEANSFYIKKYGMPSRSSRRR